MYGFLGGIFVNESDYSVIDGWHRLEFWREMGNTTIPCYLLTVTEKQEKQLHLSLNQQAADFDLTKFGLDFESFNLKDFGFTETELNDCKSSIARVEQEILNALPPSPERLKRPLIPVSMAIMNRIDHLKKVLGLPSRNDVLTHLLDRHENG